MEQRIRNKTSWVLRVLTALFLAGICGCGGAATVTGKVTFKGRPVTYGSVVLLSADGTARSGVIEPDGSYTVTGVPAGEVRIAVLSRDPSKGRAPARADKPAARRKRSAASAKPATRDWSPLPRELEDPAKSGLGCTVNSGHVGHDIDLK